LKRYEVRFLAQAVTDLDSLFCYIADKSSYEIADRYLTRIERVCLSLGSIPHRGTPVAGAVKGLRTMGFERRATLLFRVGKNSVEILRVLYGGRDLKLEIERLGEE